MKGEGLQAILCVNFVDLSSMEKMNFILICLLNTIPVIFVKGAFTFIYIYLSIYLPMLYPCSRGKENTNILLIIFLGGILADMIILRIMMTWRQALFSPDTFQCPLPCLYRVLKYMLTYLRQTHFRHEHFLCEDEACLAKKFIVFQSESDIKVIFLACYVNILMA